MKRKFMLLLTCLFIGIGLVTAQVTKVTGTVISEEDGLPVVGASILVIGTAVGTVTDMDGKFQLPNVPSSAKTLVISFIGMATQEVAIKPNLNITLKPDTETLEEVIVTAYGTAKKSAFTGSASVIKADEIGKVQTSNATEALTGKVSGVQIRTSSGQPGKNSPSILIRGISSITAGNSPLIILDGTPYEGDLNNINSQDIESMTVLKDAASNALYGARGAIFPASRPGAEPYPLPARSAVAGCPCPAHRGADPALRRPRCGAGVHRHDSSAPVLRGTAAVVVRGRGAGRGSGSPVSLEQTATLPAGAYSGGIQSGA